MPLERCEDIPKADLEQYHSDTKAALSVLRASGASGHLAPIASQTGTACADPKREPCIHSCRPDSKVRRVSTVSERGNLRDVIRDEHRARRALARARRLRRCCYHGPDRHTGQYVRCELLGGSSGASRCLICHHTICRHHTFLRHFYFGTLGLCIHCIPIEPDIRPRQQPYILHDFYGP
jgi:hypothetical protein